MLPFMMCCPYCRQPATMTIISNPAQVCVEHALEFWTGLLVYAAKDHSDLCVGHERLCTCRSCARLKTPESASHRNPDRRTVAAKPGFIGAGARRGNRGAVQCVSGCGTGCPLRKRAADRDPDPRRGRRTHGALNACSACPYQSSLVPGWCRAIPSQPAFC